MYPNCDLRLAGEAARSLVCSAVRGSVVTKKNAATAITILPHIAKQSSYSSGL